MPELHCRNGSCRSVTALFLLLFLLLWTFVQVLKVSKFQKQIFLLISSKNRTELFFDFCPKDLKWVKKNAFIISKYPLINIIKCLFIWHILEAKAEFKNNFVRFWRKWEQENLLLKLTDLYSRKLRYHCMCGMFGIPRNKQANICKRPRP